MATRDDEVFDEFVRLWSKWWSDVPETLERQDSTVVARILNLGLREGGITQSELLRELGINQPRLNKLMRKLRNAGWIKATKSKTDSRIKKSDNRFKSMTTTVVARDKIVSLRQDLAGLLRTPRAKQATARTPASKPGFLDAFEREDPGS